MACDCGSEESTVLRQHNRQLRMVNRALRKQIHDNGIALDEMFLELCATQPNQAEEQLDRLWATGAFECDPEDYEFMVDAFIDILYERESAEESNIPHTSQSIKPE